MPPTVDVFTLHDSIMDDYKAFVSSFVHIRDDRIREQVKQEFEKGYFWPDPLVQFNPCYEIAGTTEDACLEGILHPQMQHVFPNYRLYRHQAEALRLGTAGRDFVLTSGTGSGKSLTFMGAIFDYCFRRQGKSKGVVAVIVYPMNALINS